MRFRAAAALGCFVLCVIAPARASATRITSPFATTNPKSPVRRDGSKDDAVYIDGFGGAHGYGLAMDGVEGEARHGWGHDKILDLFYPGTNPGHFSGTIRVWLAEGGTQSFTLPAGGVVLK